MRILYGVVGEGMGHAIRSRVILDHLVARGHEVEIMVSGRAHGFLSKHFSGVNPIHGLHMISEDNRVRLGKTLFSNILRGIAGLPKNINAYFELIDDFEPEVVISDFESWTYYYGKLHDLPIYSMPCAATRCPIEPRIRRPGDCSATACCATPFAAWPATNPWSSSWTTSNGSTASRSTCSRTCCAHRIHRPCS
jgi:uncharacterized protein (TIGR00661 family)